MKRIFMSIMLIALMLVACNGKSKLAGIENEMKLKYEEDEEKECALEDIPEITLRILLAGSAEPQMDVLQQYDEVMTECANQYLKENNKDYRVKYETIQMKGELPTKEELDGADIICTRTSPEHADQYYIDIASELKVGKLRTVYDSVPELYWERVNVNGSIYSLLATPPLSHMIQIDNVSELESLDLDVPKELVGEPIEKWENYVSEIYEATGQNAFIQSVGYSDQECPVSAGNAWNTKFQLVLPFLGIDIESPELGVQCIYESEYGQHIQKVWSNWFDKGYVFDGEKEPKWWLWMAYDTVVKTTDEGQYQYPLTKVTYASPQVAGVDYYSTGISKESKQVELVYQFFNELTENDELHEAMIRADGKRVWFELIPKTLLVEENNFHSIYSGTLSENLKLQEERFEAAELSPAPGFVFDVAPIQEKVDAIMAVLSSQNLYGQLKSMELEGTAPNCAVEIHYIPQEIIDMMYEQGMQDVIDEANRQLEEYIK